ncbi:helix-turn-helix domain-containing protein [Actinokineospora diospyrosa]|uniref:DNA binding domain-containing protein, excisionase family n=1 Tax=Actinokineospora diospyrosa TaxID=103728 RepID=A0ABT1IH12_9PSEU|nr:helix-turn-helix domain-containing protein [Actinokineospora diospyrosa]MCP2271925.1 DNA binding domain-containing protein, excisionase family [Actinokineospora diospyrosa]
MQVETSRFYKVRAVAEMLDVSVNTVYRAVQSGELDALKIGKSLRIPERALQVYLEACGEAAYQAFVVAGESVEDVDQDAAVLGGVDVAVSE